jgi:hypothetical protein
MGCANTHLVFNHGLIVDADIDAHGYTIDGMDDVFFQGSYVYANADHHIATAAPDWRGRDGSHISMQADPNFYDDECLPALVEDVPCGMYSSDGLSYTALEADVVYKTYLDSVQNFDPGSGWDFTWYDAPFDNSLTMGCMANTRTFGVCDQLPFANFTLEIMEIFERNGNPVTDWKFGAIIDYDIGTDTADIDRSISTGWSYTAGAMGDVAWGNTKLPFGTAPVFGTVPAGTSMEPMINVKAIDADQALWDDVYWDSCYYNLSLPPGAHGHSAVSLGGDQEYHGTYVWNDFAGSDTIRFAIAQWGYAGLSNVDDPANYAAQAHLMNAWVGFDKGDWNGDGVKCDIADLVYAINYFFYGGPGPIPFMHVGDWDASGGPLTSADLVAMIEFYFGSGDVPALDWAF